MSRHRTSYFTKESAPKSVVLRSVSLKVKGAIGARREPRRLSDLQDEDYATAWYP